jgi:hypothetical protein
MNVIRCDKVGTKEFACEGCSGEIVVEGNKKYVKTTKMLPFPRRPFTDFDCPALGGDS